MLDTPLTHLRKSKRNFVFDFASGNKPKLGKAFQPAEEDRIQSSENMPGNPSPTFPLLQNPDASEDVLEKPSLNEHLRDMLKNPVPSEHLQDILKNIENLGRRSSLQEKDTKLIDVLNRGEEAIKEELDLTKELHEILTSSQSKIDEIYENLNRDALLIKDNERDIEMWKLRLGERKESNQIYSDLLSFEIVDVIDPGQMVIVSSANRFFVKFSLKEVESKFEYMPIDMNIDVSKKYPFLRHRIIFDKGMMQEFYLTVIDSLYSNDL